MNFKVPKWAVVIAAALLFFPLVVDWVAPGEGARLAVGWLAISDQPPTAGYFPFWGWLVGCVGKNVAALGWISAAGGLVCVGLVALIFGAVFGAAVRLANEGGAEGEEGRYVWVEGVGGLVAGLAFALTPGILAASTQMGPLTVALVPPLAVAAVFVGLVCRGGDVLWTIQRFRKRWYLVLGALFLAGYSAYELAMARRAFLALAFPALGEWLAVGVLPALVLAWCVRRRWLAGRWALGAAFGGWAVAVAVMGAGDLSMRERDEGRAAARIVSRIIANAEEAGRVAVVSDGTLDEVFFFTLPERMKLISLARDRDPAYGRELSDWMKGTPIASEATLTLRPKRNASEASEEIGAKTNVLEDLAFAAELGPRALIDEWVKLDKAGFEAAVASAANFFPTREKWDEACGELASVDSDEPLAKYLRHLLGVSGNALGCRLIERNDLKDAWAVFKAIADSVEPKNYGAHINLRGMVQRGFAAPKDEVDELAMRRLRIEDDLESEEKVFGAARSSGRIYADPEDVARYEKAKREAAAKRELSPEAEKFVKTVAAAPKDPKSGRVAQEAIHKAIREGKVRADVIGGRLITIDLALGDVENAEKDAIGVLRINRHDPTANAALGAFAGARGDDERAERYLRRAVATGRASIAAKNDLAWTLCRLGRLDEAETFAREATRAYGESWAFRETLAAILIRKGNVEEGERELVKAEELAEKAGIPKGKIVSLQIDRVRLLKAKGDVDHFRMALRPLQNRKDLTEEQRAEIKAMGKK